MAKSIKELGQLVPVIVEKNPFGDEKKFTLIAGFRRIQAMKSIYRKTLYAIVKGGLTDYKKYKIEFEENSRRKNLKTAEMVRASYTLKKLYEKAHPETQQGATGRGGLEGFQKKVAESATIYQEEEVPKSSYSEADKILMGGGTINDIKPKIPIERNELPTVPRFSKALAEMSNMSERTAQDVIRIGKAIDEKIINKEIVKNFDKGKISFSKMLKEVKKVEKKKKAEPKRKLAQVKPIKITFYCMDCNLMRASACPNCGDRIIICLRSYVLKTDESEGCEHFSN